MNEKISPEMKWRLILRNKLLLRRFFGENISVTLWTGNLETLRCPFHSDNRPSAKVFRDPDGDRIYCHACNRQFNSYDYVECVEQEDPREWVGRHFRHEDLIEAAKVFDFEAREKQDSLIFSYEGETPQEKIKSYYLKEPEIRKIERTPE